MKTQNKAFQVGQAAKLSRGLAAVVGQAATLRIRGEEVTVSEVLAWLEELVTNAEATRAAKAALHRAVETEDEYRARIHAKLAALRTVLVAQLSAEDLAACGL